MKITLERVQAIIAEQNCLDIVKVLPDAILSKDLAMDSLDIVETIMALEDEFDISIDESNNGGKLLVTVADLVALVEKTMGI